MCKHEYRYEGRFGVDKRYYCIHCLRMISILMTQPTKEVTVVYEGLDVTGN